MGSIAERQLEDLRTVRCCMHISGSERFSGSTTDYRFIRLGQSENGLAPGRKNTFLESDAAVRSWAILLNIYTGLEVTSFVTFTSAPSSDVHNESSPTASGGVSPGGRLACCRLKDRSLLRDIHVNQAQSYDRADSARWSVNTAVQCFIAPGTGSADYDDRNVLPVGVHTENHEHFALILTLWKCLDKEQARLYYRSTQIQEKYARSIADTFNRILHHVLVDTTLRLSQLNLPSPQDVQRMLSWNPSEPFKEEIETCIHELVASKVLEGPDAPAVCGWDGSLTYAELDNLSDIAAVELIRKGVRPGIFVLFAYEKSVYAVVAMLGILKAGGALVPLNPKDPIARLSDIITSVKANVVATTDDFASTFKGLVTHVTIISERTLTTCVGKQDTLIPRCKPSDPMLVLFTSGSTGRPKGMIHTHASMTTHAVTHGTAMAYHNARVLQFAAFTFDVAIFDIFTTLIFGGCICIPSETDRRSNIIGVINSMRVDYAILTPSFAGLIDPTEVPTLKTLAVGGEALPQDRIERWAKRVHLIQIYGPAEVGICLTMRMQSHTPGAVIGFPLANSSCWFVDPDDTSRLVPIGAVGELVVAGPSLALGYLNDEARTRLSFIDAPVWASRLHLPFRRFYKTGDLLRYNVDAFDGSLLFVGRKDAQIKLRGQRIEPGEVEFHIGRLPGVAFSMVAMPNKGCYQDRLIAVVQMRSADGSDARLVDERIRVAEVQSLTIEIVQRELHKVLPSYMVPTDCLVVCNIPFVPSLKIDRRRVYDWLTEMVSRPLKYNLAELDPLRSEESTAGSLSVYIARLLAVKELSTLLEMHDFRLQDAGMDSIKLMALTMHVQKEYDVVVHMMALVHPQTTVRDLAAWIDTRNCSSAILPSFQPRIINAHHESSVLSYELVEKLEADDVTAVTPNSHSDPQHVLLTGATGYLGSAILHHLMKIPHIKVSVLMRCANAVSGVERLRNVLSGKNWWRAEYLARVTAWPGDLAAPELGLAPIHLSQLSAPSAPDILRTRDSHRRRLEGPRIDTIIHAGAHVHYTLPYTTLFPTNVSSTLLLLRLAARSPHLSTFIHISGGETPDVDSVSTESGYLDALARAGGYTLTKNVAERVVRGAAAAAASAATRSTSPDRSKLGKLCQGKRIKVVKPGYIIGSRSTGFQANGTDFLWRLLAACVAIGAYPAEARERWVYIDDADSVARRVVDYCLEPRGELGSNDGSSNAEAVVSKAQDPSPSDHVERVLTGLRFGTIWRTTECVYGREFEALPGKVWLQRLRAKAMELGERGMLFPVLYLLEREGGSIGVDAEIDDGGREGGGALRNECETDTKRVRELVEGNVRWLIRTGFLPAIETNDAAMK